MKSSGAHNSAMEKSKKSKILPIHINEAERLQALFKDRARMSQADFGAEYEIGSQGMVWQYLNARAPLNLSAAIRFAKGLNCEVKDFSRRLALELIAFPYQVDPELAKEPSEETFALVSQLDIEASCGNGRFSDHVVVKGGLAFKQSSLRDIGIDAESARVIYAAGDSMEPDILDGRVVLIDTDDIDPADGKIYLICDPDGSVLLKKLVREFYPSTGDMRWIMRSSNSNKSQYPDKLLPDDERTHIIGRAVWTDRPL